ncbi:MAG: hypothetical protein Q9M26_00960 [Mariprofundales bacterium]|nr:hypothetical protein [Mariprofundales bacterium]
MLLQRASTGVVCVGEAEWQGVVLPSTGLSWSGCRMRHWLTDGVSGFILCHSGGEVMSGKKCIKIGTIRAGDIKVRKTLPPATQVQKSPKAYDRKRIKLVLRREMDDE